MTNTNRLLLEISNLGKEDLFTDAKECAGRVASMRALCVIAGEVATDLIKARRLSSRMIYDAVDLSEPDYADGADSGCDGVLVERAAETPDAR